jgi:outer membrane protein assembly factor BamD (BamD/ComL family)
MRFRPISPVLFAACVAAATALASDMQTPGPTPPPELPKKAEVDTRSPAKRGTHWYRHPDQDTPAEQEAYAARLSEEERWRSSEKAYDALVYAWPDSPQAARAQFNLAKLLQKRERYEKAFNEYQYLIEYYPGQFNYEEVLGYQFQIANYMMNSRRGQFLFLPGFASPDRALPLFERIVRNAPSWTNAPLAQFNIALIHDLNTDEEEAVDAYEAVLSRYPRSEWADDASYRQADCLCRLSGQNLNDENALDEAIAALSEFIRSYPGNEERVAEARLRLKDMNQRKQEMAFERARFYDHVAKRPEAALRAYEDVRKKYPQSDWAMKAEDRISELKSIAAETRKP